MEMLNERQVVVDLATLSDVPGAVAADILAQQVVVERRKGDGDTERVTRHFPAGIRLVRRR